MRKIILIIFFPLATLAQVFKAGDTLSAYKDIVPDTLINYTSVTSENYFFDVDGDAQQDFQIQAFGGGGLGGGSYYIKVIANNANSFCQFGRYDSLYHPWLNTWIVTKVARPMAYGDTINRLNAVWDNSPLFLTDNSGSAGTYKNVTDWISAFDKYIGVKYNNATDTFYGWIRVNVPQANQCYIKDYSIQLNCSQATITPASSNTVLCAGENATLSASGANTYTWSIGNNGSNVVISPTVTTSYTVNGTLNNGCVASSVITQSVNSCIGIREYELNEIKIYPNPVKDIITVLYSNGIFANSQMEIINALGEIIIQKTYTEQTDVSNLTKGYYIMRITTPYMQQHYSRFIKIE